MFHYAFTGVAVAHVDVMSRSLGAASAAHPAATRNAIPATKRRAAAASVASVNRGTI